VDDARAATDSVSPSALAVPSNTASIRMPSAVATKLYGYEQ
jgi:hypothetical protein